MTPDDLIGLDSPGAVAKAERDAARDAEQVLAELQAELQALLAASRHLTKDGD